MDLASLAQPWDAVVIGGGFFGASLALDLQARMGRVLLVERERELLQRASYANQARVHNGYHYPRSLLTGLRSSVNFPRFVEEFKACIDDTFVKYYAVGKTHSKVTAPQFETFCQRIGVPLKPLKGAARKLFNFDLIAEAYEAQEYAFNAVRLKDEMRSRLADKGVVVATGVTAAAARPLGDGMEVTIRATDDASQQAVVTARYAFNCTYSNINVLLNGSGLKTIPLRHELTELCLVRVPDRLRDLGITVMCGPFFSCMPFPARGLHTLSHVRYTPHGSWEERTSAAGEAPASASDFARRSNFPAMVADARRFMPALADCVQEGSLWELKTVLPQSEQNDSRPILFKQSPDLPHLVSVLGGKIDNIYDLPRELDSLLRSAA